MAHALLVNLVEQKSPDNRVLKFCYAFPIIIRQLQKTSHTFDLVDMHLDKLTFEELSQRVLASDALVFCISAWPLNYSEVKELTRRIRETRPEAYIVVGGIISGIPRVVLENTPVDVVSVSAEGEYVLPEVLDCLENDYDALKDVRGICYKDRRTGEIVTTGPRKLMTNDDFNQRELPAYEFFDKYLHELAGNINGRKDVPVKGFPSITARGCPFQCTFCGHLYGRKFLRKKWENFFDEMAFLEKRYGAQGFYSLDTNLFLNRQDVDDYCDEYDRRGCTWGMVAELRLSFGDYEMYRKLYDHGVRVVVLGFESGSQEMLERMKKGIHLPKARQVITDCLRAGVMVCGGLLFGTPGENKRTMKETRDYMLFIEREIEEQKKRNLPRGEFATSFVDWSLLVPTPSSELYRIAVEDGVIDDEEAYTIKISSSRFKTIKKGSTFRIRLNKEGYVVNMSEFSSNWAMIYYARYISDQVKMRTSFFMYGSFRDKLARFIPHLSKMCWNYAAYCAVRAADMLAGRKGYVPRDKRGAAPELSCAGVDCRGEANA